MIMNQVPTEFMETALAGEPIEECQLITRRDGKIYVCQKGEASYGWAIQYYRNEPEGVRFQKRGAAIVQLVEVIGSVKDGAYLYPSENGKAQAEAEGQHPIGIAESESKSSGWIDALLF